MRINSVGIEVEYCLRALCNVMGLQSYSDTNIFVEYMVILIVILKLEHGLAERFEVVGSVVICSRRVLGIYKKRNRG